MATANERQIGGDHYQNAEGYQHWDWVSDIKLGYHAGNASKYAYRWRKKDGLKDLEKCLHYIDKCAELSLQGSMATQRTYAFWNFVASNDLEMDDAALIFYIMEGNWDMASGIVQRLIREAGGASE